MMPKKEARQSRKITRRTVRVKPHSYQPKKAELEEEFLIDATPEELATAILQPVKIVEDS